MPGGGPQGVLKIAIERFDIPAHVVEAGQFRRGKQNWIQQRGDQAATAKTVSMNEEHPDRESGFVVRVFDLAEIIPVAERT